MCPILEVGLLSCNTRVKNQNSLLVLIYQYFKQSLLWEKPSDGVLSPAAPHLVLLFVLQFEADRRAFIITINSFGTELSKEDRAKLFPHCGKLYPEGLAQLARADDYEQVKAVADFYPVSINVSFFLSVIYSSCFLGFFFLHKAVLLIVATVVKEYKLLFEGAGSNPGDKTLEDRFFEHEVRCIMGYAVRFTAPCTHGTFISQHSTFLNISAAAKMQTYQFEIF